MMFDCKKSRFCKVSRLFQKLSNGEFLLRKGNDLKEKQGILKRNFKKSTFLKKAALLKKAVLFLKRLHFLKKAVLFKKKKKAALLKRGQYF